MKLHLSCILATRSLQPFDNNSNFKIGKINVFLDTNFLKYTQLLKKISAVAVLTTASRLRLSNKHTVNRVCGCGYLIHHQHKLFYIYIIQTWISVSYQTKRNIITPRACSSRFGTNRNTGLFSKQMADRQWNHTRLKHISVRKHRLFLKSIY